MALDILIYILCFSLIIVGIAGCIIPGLPGPPIAYVGYLLLLFTEVSDYVTWWMIAILGIMSLFTVIADFVVPMMGVKVFGGTKWGNWGCIIGTIIGLFYPPLGIILGPFLGALVFELIATKSLSVSFKSAVGSFIGFIVGTGLKIIITLVILLVAIITIIAGYI